MARALPDIIANIKANYVSQRASAGLTFDDPTLWSVVNIKRLMVWVFAICALVLESLWDIDQAEVNTLLDEDKPHTLPWYRSMALKFQLGSDLVTDDDYYDNSALTSDQIAAQMIIANAAALDTGSSILIKMVKTDGTDYLPLDPVAELPAATAYMQEIADAGIKIETLSVNPDHIQAVIDIQYDPLILKADGSRLDGTTLTPVQDAFKAYLFNIDFKTGRYFKSDQFDVIKAVNGVKDLAIRSVLMQVDGTTNWVSVDLQYDSLAGFIRLYNTGDLTLNFTPFQP